MEQDSIRALGNSIPDEESLARLAAPLWARVGTAVGNDDLLWARTILGEQGDEALRQALIESGALQGDPPRLHAVPLATFLLMLGTQVLEQPVEQTVPRLVWTLPPGHSSAPIKGRSYVDTVTDVIRGAHNSIMMVSPYLEARGLGLMHKELLRALARGVDVVLITHRADNIASFQSRALEELRRGTEHVQARLTVYTVKTEVGSESPSTLVHAKLVIVDATTMLVGSANLTGPGLSANLEAGVVLGPAAAVEGRIIVKQLLHSNLVHKAFESESRKTR